MTDAPLPAPDVPREAPAPEDGGVPRLRDRTAGVLLRPVETFSALEPAWGWAGPWLVLAGAGLVRTVVSLARVDHADIAARRSAYAQEFLSEQVRRQAAAAAEDSGKLVRSGAWAAKMLGFLGPTVGTLLAIVVMGLILFAASVALGGKRDLLRCVSVAAHAKLVALVGIACVVFATLVGNPQPRTSLGNVADEVGNPCAFAALDGVDAVGLWHGALLGVGLCVALGVPRRRAALFATGLYVVPWLLSIALGAVAGAVMRK